jgi:hypothetical protein
MQYTQGTARAGSTAALMDTRHHPYDHTVKEVAGSLETVPPTSAEKQHCRLKITGQLNPMDDAAQTPPRECVARFVL